MADVLKQYHEDRVGESAAYWQDHWDEFDLDDAIARYARDPLRRVFEANVAPGDLLLEAGCGLAQYVVQQRRLGVRAVGLDFASETLLRVRRHDADVPLVVGDVNALPFRDRIFDTYFSGGVVEHLESGPDSALREAARVTRLDGVLLISVPYLSQLRRMLTPFKRTWRPTAAPDDDASSHGLFWQYIFSPRRFEQILGHAGLQVRQRVGYGIIRGLVDAPVGIGRLLKRRAARRASRDIPPAGKPITGTEVPSRAVRLLVAEDDSIPVVGRAIPLLRNLVANMAMYVCERSAPDVISSDRP